MRTLALAALVLAAFLSPEALANKANPASGSAVFLNPGDKQNVKVSGFGGCSFEVMLMTTDSKVVQLSQKKDGAAKGHNVTLEAVGVGTAMVTITTANGTNPGCQGFNFTYPVTVTPDTKDLQKAYKAETKSQLKLAKDALNAAIEEVCPAIDDVVDAVKDGEITPDDAIDALQDVGALAATGLADLARSAVDTSFGALFTSPEALEYLGIDPSVLRYLPGACGDYDKFEDQLEKLIGQAEKRFEKKIKKAIKDVEKIATKQGEAILFIFQTILGVPQPQTPVALPANPPQTPAPAPPKPLEKSWTSSGRLSSSGVSSLRIGGIADSGQVSVEITGPDGFSDSDDFDVNEDCGWIADFGGIKPGVYTVKITQGDQSQTFTTVVV